MARQTKHKHNSRLYRSGLEKEAAAFLKDRQKKVVYEQLKIEWEDLRYRTYTPDFELDNGILVETKGIFDNEDRRKHIAIKEQHPELDIRFVFSNANAKLYKGAKSRMVSGGPTGIYQKNGGQSWVLAVIQNELFLKQRGKTDGL